MSPIRVGLLAIGVVVCLVVALAATRAGVYPFGTSLDDFGDCLRGAMLPSVADVDGYGFHDGWVHGERTLVPMGLVCSGDRPGDGVGPRVVARQSWPLTLTAAGGLLAALACIAGLLSPIRRSRTTRRG